MCGSRPGAVLSWPNLRSGVVCSGDRSSTRCERGAYVPALRTAPRKLYFLPEGLRGAATCWEGLRAPQVTLHRWKVPCSRAAGPIGPIRRSRHAFAGRAAALLDQQEAQAACGPTPPPPPPLGPPWPHISPVFFHPAAGFPALHPAMTRATHPAVLALALVLAAASPLACRGAAAAANQSVTAVGPAVLTNCFSNAELFGFETSFAAEITNGLNYTQMGSFPTQVGRACMEERPQGATTLGIPAGMPSPRSTSALPACNFRNRNHTLVQLPPLSRTTRRTTFWRCPQRRPSPGCPRRAPLCTRCGGSSARHRPGRVVEQDWPRRKQRQAECAAGATGASATGATLERGLILI